MIQSALPDGPPRPSDPAPPAAPADWRRLHRDLLACTHCVDSGHLAEAAPMFQGRPGQPLMLVGQAPGIVELGPRKPFAGRAGAELGRWMTRAGFRDDDHFRSLTYVTSITKCFPGKATTGSGDRRPSAAEVENCRGWLDRQLALQRPRLLILVGTLAIERFLPGRPLGELVGLGWASDGTGGAAIGASLFPLPHPSGASRWLNLPANRRLLESALAELARTWPGLAGAAAG
jgi:uracil-DNA glycosylase family 4